MRRALVWIWVSLLLACGAQEPSKTPEPPAPRVETAAAVGAELRLTVTGAVCEAQLGDRGERVRLGLQGPCAILRDREGKAQTYRYADAGGVQVYIVIGELKGACGTSAQGLLARGGKLSASELVQRGSYKCPKEGLDEKDFWMFSHK